MSAALRTCQPAKKRGPWLLLIDGEKFLMSKASKAAYVKKGVKVLKIPPRSPDCNPIEKFWGWLRREMKSRDLLDLSKKRKALGKTAYKQRLRAVLKQGKTQAVAKRFATDMMRVCKAIVKAKGYAVKG